MEKKQEVVNWELSCREIEALLNTPPLLCVLLLKLDFGNGLFHIYFLYEKFILT